MVAIKDGQCGMCAHYGDNNPGEVKLIQIRMKHEAPETLLEECGHPQLAPLHLVVTANSGCAGFEPVATER
ncbi:MAG: hypothetical protein U0075_05090 [Thermomicrobiales bacterium]|jgi:hypothetical protein